MRAFGRPLRGARSLFAAGGGRALWGVFAVSFVVFTVYQLTVVTLPFYLALEGFRELAAGTLTAVFMAGAVVGPLFAPNLFAAPGLRQSVGWSLLAHAIATGLVGVVSGLWPLLALNAIRGLTFGLLAAALPVVVVHNAPRTAHGAALGTWGLVCTVPAIFAPSLGVALVERTTLAMLTAGAGLLTLLGLLPLASARSRGRWPGRRRESRPDHRLDWRLGGLRHAASVFLCATMTYGAVISFMPLFLTGDRPTIATSVAFLLAMGCALPLGRLLGGARSRRALAVGMALVATGLGLILASTVEPISLAAGGAYGIGFGIVTTASQLTLLTHVGAHRSEFASAIFSVLFNAGIGLGGLAAGVFGELASLRAAFAACALASILAVPVAIAVGREAAAATGGER